MSNKEILQITLKDLGIKKRTRKRLSLYNIETLEDPNKVFIYKDLEKLYYKNFEYTYEEGKYIKKLELSENELNKVKEESIAKEKEKEKEELAKKENSLLNKIKNKFNKKSGSSIDEKGNDTL